MPTRGTDEPEEPPDRTNPVAHARLSTLSGFAWGLVAFALNCGCGWLSSFAADKSGVTPNTISLPSGPGSIEGLGEAFQPSLNTGTAKYGLGLRLPPGTAGHSPSLSLRYEGGSGNGPVGFGWNLPLPNIQRQCDKGIPRYVDADNQIDDDRDGETDEYDERDVFINEMKEELVPQADGYYFCENEGAFIRYRRNGDAWEATLPDGTRLDFGLTAAARVEDAATGRIFRWLLEKSTDTHGNTIIYSYRPFPGDANRNQKYLAAVHYGPGAPPWDNYHFAAFAYEDRSDWFEDCRSGFIVRTGKRLKEVVIGTQGPTLSGHLAGDFDGDGNTDYLNRRFELGYLDYAGANSHWSLLAMVRQVGADGASALPPATFGYAVSDPPDVLSAGGNEIGGQNEPPFVMDNGLADLLDLNGDGLPDLLKTAAGGGPHTGYLNRGERTLDGARVIQWGPPRTVDADDGLAWNVDLESANNVAHLADLDGDGIADLAYKSVSGDVFYFANRANLSWGRRQTMSIQDVAPPAPFGDPNVRTADLDFDKRIDVVQAIPVGNGADYRIWFNLGGQRYARSLTAPQETGLLFSQPGVHLLDFNGDRVPDAVRLSPAQVSVAAGLGYGRFADPVVVSIPTPGLEDPQVAAAKLQDVTGDGLADLVLERAAPGQLWYWLNLGNYSLAPRRIISGMPTGVGPQPVIRWADLNGNGTTDLIYADSQSTPRLRTVDIGELLGCVPGHNVLTRIANGIGRVTTIQYEASTRFALEDEANGQAWPDAMPFPVSVVSAVITSDSLGHEYQTRFRYHHGYYDGVEKEFRGFGRVEQIEIGDATAPTLVTRSFFDTGRLHEALKGKLMRQRAEEENGGVFWDETTTWTDPPRTLLTGVNGQPVQYAHPTASERRIIERGQGDERVLESEFAYDRFGNQTLHANFGIVVDGNRSAFDDERVIATEFAINTNAWLIRFPCRTEVRDEQGKVISRTETFYDDPTFGGGNLGEVSAGDTTMVRDWIDPGVAGAFVTSSRLGYDPHGNAERFLDPLAMTAEGVPDPAHGHWREVRFDARFHTYPEEEIIHVGGGRTPLIVRADYDDGFATVVRSLDFNGNETGYGYDVFARITRIVRPGDSDDYPTTEYDYALGVSAGSNRVVNYVETRALDKAQGSEGSKRDHYLVSRQFVDGMGRSLMSRVEAGPAAGQSRPRVVVAGAVLFNARAAVSIALNPFFSTRTGETLDSLLEFEDVSQAGWQGIFHERGEMKRLDLPGAHQTRSIHDALLRAEETINPDGTRSRVQHQPLLERLFDENDTDPATPQFDTPRVLHRDGLGRHIRTDELVRLNDDGTPSAHLVTWTTQFEYDLNDRLTRVTDSQNNVRTMEHDGLGRLTFLNDPDRGVMRYQYDDASNLLETRDARDQRITRTYDGVNRLLTEDYHDEDQPYSFGYRYNPVLGLSPTNRPDVAYFHDEPVANIDLGDGAVGTAANTRGQLACVWDLSGEEHTSFDARGRLDWIVKRTVDPVRVARLHTAVPSSTLVSYRTRFEHDSLDRLVRLIYPDGDYADYRYNDRGELMAIGGDVSGVLVTIDEYLPSNQPAGLRFGNGVETRCTFDNRRRLRSLATRRGGDPEYMDVQYDLDPASNFLAIQDQRPASAVPSGDARRNTQLFSYDGLHRLARVQYSYHLPGEQVRNDGEIHYRYDRIGNMLSQTSTFEDQENGIPIANIGRMDAGGSAGRWNRVGRAANDPPGPHALTSIAPPPTQTNTPPRAYAYDNNGNMAGLDGLACTWDFKDRLVTVENAGMRADYVYDSADRRIVKRVACKPGSTNRTPRVTTVYINKFFEVREHDQPTKYVWRGNTRIARVTGSLSASERLQRLRIHPGWNLASLAVHSTNTAIQIQGSNPQPEPVIEEMYQWDPATSGYKAVPLDENLRAGTVLWLKAPRPGMLTLRGPYSSPTDQPVSIGGGYYPGPGLEALEICRALPGAAAAVWSFAPEDQAWLADLKGELNRPAELPEFLAPGDAVFINATAPGVLHAPDPGLRIRFYHQDYLGSSGIITDSTGKLVEETAYYPFGSRRTNFRGTANPEPYGFSQKETDRESGLQYFEARFLANHLGRFLSCDPLGASATPGRLADPQRAHPYAYAANNPLARVDPLGLDDEPSLWAKATAFGEGVYDTVEAAVGGTVTTTVVVITAPGWAGPAALAGIGYGAYSAADSAIKAITGDDFSVFSDDYDSLSEEERWKEGGKGVTEGVLVVGAIYGASKATPKAAPTEPPPNYTGQTAYGKTHNASSTAYGKTQAGGPTAAGKTQGSPTQAATEAAQDLRNQQWSEYVYKKAAETRAARERTLVEKGWDAAEDALTAIFDEADAIFGHPVLPGD